ncbi:hypothetical protein [Streptomyces sp. NBC_00273]|uniref:hypothetical protein n=1 Tax=Streptomyces sp. NBC_00273 TaxID=2903644 RepID=UPI002E2A84EE|nr:hypothetical protein [Streptomyces sp. NBC_00273]
MRTRTRVIGTLLGAALLAGGTVTTAAAAPQPAAPSATESVSDVTSTLPRWRPTHKRYPSYDSCNWAGQTAWENDARVTEWDCRSVESGERYELWLNVV